MDVNKQIESLKTEGKLEARSFLNKEIKIQNLSPVQVNNHRITLGRGTFSEVYLAKDVITDKLYAVKHIEKNIIMSQLHSMQVIYNEIEIHSKLNHRNIVRLYNIYENSTAIYLIMEHANNGNLYSLIKRMGSFDESTAKRYFLQVCSAVYFLHKNNIIHRDIKPENILLDFKDDIKLCDFGWACRVDENATRSTICGTVEYMAPEILNKEVYDKSIDIWSLGVLLYEMVHGFSPFNAKGGGVENVSSNIKNIKFEIKKGLSTECRDLIAKMLEKDSTRRIDIEEILRHPFIAPKKKYARPRSLSDRGVCINRNKTSIKNTKVLRFTKLLFDNELSFLDKESVDVDNTPIKPVNTTKNLVTPKNKIVLKFNINGKKTISSSALVTKAPVMIKQPQTTKLSKKIAFPQNKEEEQRNTGSSSVSSQKDDSESGFIENIINYFIK